MELTIKQLTKKDTEYISIICGWLYDWWGNNEDFTMQKMKAYVTNSMCYDRIPQTYGLFESDKIIGVYISLVN